MKQMDGEKPQAKSVANREWKVHWKQARCLVPILEPNHPVGPHSVRVSDSFRQERSYLSRDADATTAN